jgi:SAUR family protein
MVLVGDGEGDSEERRIMVRVEMLKEPCMAAVLEMAAQQFGYGQRGVLRIPCGADRFQQMVGAACAAAR